MDQNNTIKLIYISQSSLGRGNFTLNGNTVITDVYQNINKLNNLLLEYNKNISIVLFDSIQNEDQNMLNSNINLIKINQQQRWSQIVKNINIILKNNNIFDCLKLIY